MLKKNELQGVIDSEPNADSGFCFRFSVAFARTISVNVNKAFIVTMKWMIVVNHFRQISNSRNIDSRDGSSSERASGTPSFTPSVVNELFSFF